ncbi:MAG TPA: pantetheine-phosphate adenylyltransferase [Nitrolancea sp.]|nr:pantetheine-phosphate adenylyltransferase [Nitrolancea sp.]
MERLAVYPGSFDPITNGHVDVAERAARIFDTLIIGIYESDAYGSKQPLFSAEERRRLAESAVQDIPNVRVDIFRGLAVDYARSVGAKTIVRGLRAVSDFEYEFKYAHMNRHLAPEIDVICLMTSSQQSFISSSFIREVASLGGDVRGLVPNLAADALEQKFGAISRK